MRNNISAKIKVILKKANVLNKVSTYSSTITVVCLSPISNELVEEIKALQTVEAHGDIMNDTRSYTGYSIQFDYKWEITDAEITKGKEIFASWSDDSKKERVSFMFHFEKDLKNAIGPMGPQLAALIFYGKV